jgi:hypothetical protein
VIRAIIATLLVSLLKARTGNPSVPTTLVAARSNVAP